MKDEKKIIGENLRTLRVAIGVSRKNIGEKLGYHQATLGKIERGEISPSYRLVMQLVGEYKYKGDIRNISKENGVIKNV